MNSPCDLPALSPISGRLVARLPSTAEEAQRSTSEIFRIAGIDAIAVGFSIACQAAMVDSPKAARAFLEKHKTSLDPDLAETLEIVGHFTTEVIVIALSLRLLSRTYARRL